MRRLTILVWAVGLVVATACNAASSPSKPIHEQVTALQGQVVTVEVDEGEVSITGTADSQLVIDGELTSPERVSYGLSQSLAGIHISAKVLSRPFGGFAGPPVRLQIQIPQDTTLRVETSDADVTLLSFRGEASVESVSADILAQDVSGTIALRSGRGDVTLRNGSGKTRVLGEHGLLTIENTVGEVGSSTIMGTIRYIGQPGNDDAVHLETDHGSVAIQLGSASNVSVQVNSTSGNVACMLPGASQTGRRCTGTLGGGAGTLTVRTVSGDVAVQLLP